MLRRNEKMPPQPPPLPLPSSICCYSAGLQVLVLVLFTVAALELEPLARLGVLWAAGKGIIGLQGEIGRASCRERV